MLYPAFAHLMQTFAASPWQALALSRDQQKSTRRREWELAALGFAFAQFLDAQPTELARFYRDPFFEVGYRPNPQKVLLHVLQYQRDDRHGDDADRAQVQAAALQGAFDAGWAAKEVLAALIEHKGFAPFKRWFYQADEDADDSGDVQQVDDDRRQLGLSPTARGQDITGADLAGDDGGPDGDHADDGDSDGEHDQTGELPTGHQSAAGAANPRSPKYADPIDNLYSLGVLLTGDLFDHSMDIKEKEFFDIRVYRVSNGKLRYRRFEAKLLK